MASQGIKLVPVVIALHLAIAQTTAGLGSFEAASVKLNRSGRRGKGYIPSPGMITVRNYPLRELIGEAYHVPAYRVLGGPSWVDTDGYDIIAKAPGRATAQEMKPMLQALLGNRFRLLVHQDTKQVPGYWLVISKGGPKMTVPRDDDPSPSGVDVLVGKIVAYKSTMARLAVLLGDVLHAPIVDHTGLNSPYNFTLEWTQDVPSDAGGNNVADFGAFDNGTLLAAVQSQLGLRLESHPSPTEVILIDRVDRPTEN